MTDCACIGPGTRTSSLFGQAAKVFPAWTDQVTGRRVLRLHTRGQDPKGSRWSTAYHQFRCFLDGGQQVLLSSWAPAGDDATHPYFLLDLTTGALTRPFPPGYGVIEVSDGARTAALIKMDAAGNQAVLWDLRADRELAAVSAEGWMLNCINLLSDDRRAIAFYYRGKPYDEPVQSRHYLLTAGEPPRLLMEAENAFCSHVLSCPADANLYSYDRWPAPLHDIEQAIHLRTLDGRSDEPLRMTPETLRPADMWGARDHYLWTPDSRRIVSYLCPHRIEMGPGFNHFRLEWWLSVTDWRTGEDLAAKYPPGRWDGHMQVSPDSRYIVCGGGPGFDRLFAVEIEKLRQGWHEHVICAYPPTVSVGSNGDPFPYPFVLPDQSGVIFCAGWPGPEHGVYLAEWPAELGGDRG